MEVIAFYLILFSPKVLFNNKIQYLIEEEANKEANKKQINLDIQ